MEIFQTWPKKQPSFERPKSTVAQMASSSNHYALKVQRLDKILAHKAAPKLPQRVKLWQLLEGHPKAAFSKKVQRGDQGKFFKNRLKTSPRLKGPKVLWRKLHSTLFSIHLQREDWRIFWREQRLQKCSNDQVMAIFAKSPNTRIF